MGLSVSVSVFLCVSIRIVRIDHTLEKIKNVKNDVCRFLHLHLPPNGIITNIAFRDRDLLFGGLTF